MVLLEGVGASPGTADISGPKLLSSVPNRPGGLPSSLDDGSYRVRHVCSGVAGDSERQQETVGDCNNMRSLGGSICNG